MTKIFQTFLMGLCFFAATAYAGERTPLHNAVMARDKAKVEALLAQGADVNARGEDEETPLRWAAVITKAEDIAELLLVKGADVNAREKGGNTPLHTAISHENRDVAMLLLAKGADVNAKGLFGWTPLHSATVKGNIKFAEILLAKGADVNATDDDGDTPLAKANKKDLAELLVAKGADVNAKNLKGRTPLHRAAEWGHKDGAQVLLANGADVNAKDTQGNTPLRLAEGLEQKVVAELLKAHIFEQAFQQARRNPRAALVQLTAQIKDKPNDVETRHLIIKLASELKPFPAIPEEARRHFVEGTTIVKAGKNPAEQALAAQSFNEALKVAPWWPDAWYNLAVAQELAGQFDEAEKSFTLYILSNPGEKEQREAQDRIYALAAKRKLSGGK